MSWDSCALRTKRGRCPETALFSQSVLPCCNAPQPICSEERRSRSTGERNCASERLLSGTCFADHILVIRRGHPWCPPPSIMGWRRTMGSECCGIASVVRLEWIGGRPRERWTLTSMPYDLGESAVDSAPRAFGSLVIVLHACCDDPGAEAANIGRLAVRV